MKLNRTLSTTYTDWDNSTNKEVTKSLVIAPINLVLRDPTLPNSPQNNQTMVMGVSLRF